MGNFLFQTTNFVTEKLHEYFIFFSESCSKPCRGAEKTCRDTELIPGIGEHESPSQGNIHHPEIQTELKIFE